MAVPLSQLGHLLVYFMRYGPANSLQESYGAHAYFPSVAKASAGLLGLLVLVAVILVGLARLVGRRRIAGQRQVPAAALPELVAVLLPLQLAIFIGQETIELLATGRLTSLEDVPLLWGLASCPWLCWPRSSCAGLRSRWKGRSTGSVSGSISWPRPQP